MKGGSGQIQASDGLGQPVCYTDRERCAVGEIIERMWRQTGERCQLLKLSHLVELGLVPSVETMQKWKEGRLGLRCTGFEVYGAFL